MPDLKVHHHDDDDHAFVTVRVVNPREQWELKDEALEEAWRRAVEYGYYRVVDEESGALELTLEGFALMTALLGGVEVTELLHLVTHVKQQELVDVAKNAIAGESPFQHDDRSN